MKFRPDRCPGGKKSEVQAAFAGSFSHGLDAAVIDERATVEYDILDASLDGALGNELAYDSCCCNVGAGLERAAQICFERGGRRERLASNIMDVPFKPNPSLP